MTESPNLATMALQKRTSETALMPPPPPPKRLKAPPKTLPEDSYTTALVNIIERDFFPTLKETRRQERLIDAMVSGNPITITKALEETSVLNQEDVFEEDEVEGENQRRMQRDMKGMGLDAFQAKYTSEDNASFNTLLDLQNLRRREKNAWAWNGHRKLSKQQLQLEQKRAMLSGEQRLLSLGENENEESWSKQIETWKYNPLNALMHPLPGVDEQEETVAEGAPKQILHSNTRLPQQDSTLSSSLAPSPSPSTILAAINSHPSRSDSPKVRGYGFVSTPRPEELGTPPLTWGEVGGTPVKLEDTPSPFHIKEAPPRDQLARRLADRAQKSIAARQNAYGTRGTPMRTPTIGGRKETDRSLGSRLMNSKGEMKDIPKFASSPDVRKAMLTPAGQRLLRGSLQGSRMSANSLEGKKENDERVISNTPTPLMSRRGLGVTPSRKKD